MKFYHIFITTKSNRVCYNVKNIVDLEDYYDTVIIPYVGRDLLHIDSNTLPSSMIKSFKVFESPFELDHIDEVYADYDSDFNPTHDAKRHDHDVTQKIIAEAKRRRKTEETPITNKESLPCYLYRGIGLTVASLAIFNSIMLLKNFWVPVRIQHAVDVFALCIAVILVWKNRWEWKTPYIALGFLASVLTIITYFGISI